MRGLPPPPDDVCHFEVDLTNDGARSSVGFWLLAPGSGVALISDLELVLADLIFAALDLLTQLTTAGTQLITCRLVTFSPQYVALAEPVSNNHGAWNGSQANEVALGIAWLTGDRGKGATPVNRLPGFPDDFTDDHLTVNDTGRGNVLVHAGAFINAVNAISHGGITSVTLGTLRRQRGGLPLPAAEFSPYQGARPVRPIARVSRRMYVRR